jgi:hypothetical protein
MSRLKGSNGPRRLLRRAIVRSSQQISSRATFRCAQRREPQKERLAGSLHDAGSLGADVPIGPMFAVFPCVERFRPGRSLALAASTPQPFRERFPGLRRSQFHLHSAGIAEHSVDSLLPMPCDTTFVGGQPFQARCFGSEV